MRSTEEAKEPSVLEDDSTICVLCRFHDQECTFLHNPYSRKRHLAQDGDDLEASKRRFAEHTPAMSTQLIRDPGSRISLDARGESRRRKPVLFRLPAELAWKNMMTWKVLVF